MQKFNILYSFNKVGFEAKFWDAEIRKASTEEINFIPFNHGIYLSPQKYLRAQLLDNLYYENNAQLLNMYQDVKDLMTKETVHALIADNCHPYHPDWLRNIPQFKVLRTSDGPLCTYDRDFAYAHAYDHILYHSPAYSKDLNMKDKLEYLGVKSSSFWPMALFENACQQELAEEEVFAAERDIDVLFIGTQHVGKMPFIAKIQNALGSQCKIHGMSSLKKNIYYNLRFGFPGWISPVKFEDYIPLYKRAKIGFNLHNRGKYTLGSYRLFDLPGNGVMQISDGGEYLNDFFEVDKEIVGYDDADELIEKIKYFLKHDEEREAIARNGYRRVMKDYKIKDAMQKMGAKIKSLVLAKKNKGTPCKSH